MNGIIQKIFRNKAVTFERLLQYGFTLSEGKYRYFKDILDEQMRVNVEIDGQGNIKAYVIDLDSNEPYTLFLAEDALGSFVGGVRDAYEELLSDIAEKCCEKQVFKSKYTNAIIKYVRDKYADEPEFLWEKFDDNAIWRRKDNGKWYGVLLKVAKYKIGGDGDDIVEILDLRIDPKETLSTIDLERYYPAYHMNKKSWITICLDGSVDLQEIYGRIDDSFALALKK